LPSPSSPSPEVPPASPRERAGDLKEADPDDAAAPPPPEVPAESGKPRL
jgi:hypothetical protein